MTRTDNSRLPARPQMPCEEVSAGEGERTFLWDSQGSFPHKWGWWLTSHPNGRLSLSYYLVTSGAFSERVWGMKLTGQLVSFEVRQSREFCSANVAFLRLRDGGNVTRCDCLVRVDFFGLEEPPTMCSGEGIERESEEE